MEKFDELYEELESSSVDEEHIEEIYEALIGNIPAELAIDNA